MGPSILLHLPTSLSPRLVELLQSELADTLATDIKYEGYQKRDEWDFKKRQKLESTTIPSSFDYLGISGLSREVVEKLGRVKPVSLGQASRIPGITPAALSILTIYLKKHAERRINSEILA